MSLTKSRFATSIDGKSFKVMILSQMIVWSLTCTLEFQGPKDLMPLLPAISIVAAVPAWKLLGTFQSTRRAAFTMLFIAAILYASLMTHHCFVDFATQKRSIEQLIQQFPANLAVNLTELAVLNEQRTPTKYQLMSKCDDHDIYSYGHGCQEIENLFAERALKYLILTDRGPTPSGQCAEFIRDSVLSANLVAGFSIPFMKQRDMAIQVYAPWN